MSDSGEVPCSELVSSDSCSAIVSAGCFSVFGSSVAFLAPLFASSYSCSAPLAACSAFSRLRSACLFSFSCSAATRLRFLRPAAFGLMLNCAASGS